MGVTGKRNHGDVGLFAWIEGAYEVVESEGFSAAEGGGFEGFFSGDESLSMRAVAGGQGGEAGFFEQVADVVARDRIAAEADGDFGIEKFF